MISLHIGHSVLVTCFMANCVVSGMSYANSAYYYVHWLEAFGSPSWLTARIGSLNMAAVCLAGPVSGISTNRFGYRTTVVTGGVISTVSLVAASFSKSIWTLLIFYTITGIGWGLCFIPVMLATTHFFPSRYHGIIVGIISAGGGCGHFLTPFIIEKLTQTYTWRGSLLIEAGFCAQIIVCGALIRPVPTMTDDTKGKNSLRLNIFKNLSFLFLLISMLLFTTGLSVIFVHIAYSIQRFSKVSEERSSLAISILGLTSLFGRVIHGTLAKLHRVNAVVQAMISYIAAGGATVSIPFVANYAIDCVIAAVIGLGIGPYGGATVIIVMSIVGQKDAATAYGYVNFMGGCGLYIGAPIAGALYDFTSDYRASMYFGGSMMILSSISMVYMAYSWRTDRVKAMNIIDETDNHQGTQCLTLENEADEDNTKTDAVATNQVHSTEDSEKCFLLAYSERRNLPGQTVKTCS